MYYFNILQTSPLCKYTLDALCSLFTAGYSIHSSTRCLLVTFTASANNS